MCSGGDGYDYELQAALGRMSRLKAKQNTKHSTNVVLGGEQEYRRNTSEGAKDVGLSGEDIANRKMSATFAGNKGKGAALAAAGIAGRKRKKEEAERMHTVGGVGGI